MDDNMVMILTRDQLTLTAKRRNRPIEDITMDDIWPVLSIAMANAEVVIIMDEKMFSVIKHKYMRNPSTTYHISTLPNIITAR